MVTFKSLDGRPWVARVKDGIIEIAPNTGGKFDWQSAHLLVSELQEAARFALGLPRTYPQQG